MVFNHSHKNNHISVLFYTKYWSTSEWDENEINMNEQYVHEMSMKCDLWYDSPLFGETYFQCSLIYTYLIK